MGTTILQSLMAVACEVTYDSNELFVAMSVFKWNGTGWVAVGAPVAAPLIDGISTYGALFTPPDTSPYVVTLMAYTDGTFTTPSQGYSPSSRSFGVDNSIINRFNAIVIGNNELFAKVYPLNYQPRPISGLDPAQPCNPVQQLYQNSDTFIELECLAMGPHGYPIYYDFSNVSQIKVSLLNTDNSVLTQLFTAGNVVVAKAQFGRIRAYIPKAAAALLLLGVQDVQVVATTTGLDTIMVGTGIVNVLAERYPGV